MYIRTRSLGTCVRTYSHSHSHPEDFQTLDIRIRTRTHTSACLLWNMHIIRVYNFHLPHSHTCASNLKKLRVPAITWRVCMCVCVCVSVCAICICINASCVYCTADHEDINTQARAKDEHTFVRLFANWQLAFSPPLDMRYQ